MNLMQGGGKPPDAAAKACCPDTARYAGDWKSRDGRTFHIRPIAHDDGPALADFYQRLSDPSLYFRFFHTIKPNELLSARQLADICTQACDRSMILVVDGGRRQGAPTRINAVARLDRSAAQEAEFAITVSDDQQGAGLGAELLRRMIRYARDEALERITCTMLPGNVRMRRLGRKMGFRLRLDTTEHLVLAELVLR